MSNTQVKTERFISQDKRRVTSSGGLRLAESLLSILRSDCHQGTLYCEGQSQGVGFGRNGVGARHWSQCSRQGNQRL